MNRSKSPTVCDEEYIDPLCIVLLSGKTMIIGATPRANAPSIEAGTWISLVHCSAPIE
ncbi:Uncharacterised protein [Sphingomonas paucimobilis]|nr:Uncharacterised protein [Sphingomonas paucimobilis]